MPRASIIVPVHNGARYLDQLYADLSRQTCPDFEVLMVDDGSTDDSLQKMEALSRKDPRFRAFGMGENRGPGLARNRGIDEATGTFILFCDVDDVMLPETVEAVCTRAEETQADIVVYQMRHFIEDPQASYPSPDAWNATGYEKVFAGIDHADTVLSDFRNWPWAKCFRRSFLEEKSLRFPALFRTEDLPFTCEALLSAQRIALLDKELYLYRWANPTGSTRNRDTHPLDFFEACRLFHGWLKSAGLWETAQLGYTAWAGLCCKVNLMELSTPEAFSQVYSRLHDGGLAELDLIGVYAKGDKDIDVTNFLNIVENNDLARGTFLLWRESDAQRLLELEDLRNSRTYRAGKALLSPAINLRDRLRK